MPSRTEKLPSTSAGRGKRRFEPTAEPDRRVLPERPRREVDDSIVADLLGGDPAGLKTFKAGELSKIKADGLEQPPGERVLIREVLAESVDSRQLSLGTGAELRETTVEKKLGVDPAFQSFVERWKHALRKGQLKMCEVLFQKTYAQGRNDCETSYSELSGLTGLTMRQCFNIMGQLEALKFIERYPSAGGANRKGQGSKIIFYLFPKN